MANEDFMSFEEVIAELQLSDEELQKMVSEGKVRAIRAQRTLKFKRNDIDELKGLANVGSNTDADQTLIIPDFEGLDDSKILSVDDSNVATLLEVPPAGETQEISAAPLPDFSQPGLSDTAEIFGIEPAPLGSEEDEVGTELNFGEVPLGDTQELPAPIPSLQDATDTDLNLGEIEASGPLGDDVTDTLIPSIDLSSDDDESDDTSDTVIPTIDLSTDDELTDEKSDTVIPIIDLSTDDTLEEDTSDTVIPTIELSNEDDLELEGSGETAFPTIELAEEPTGALSSGMATDDLSLDGLGETDQESSEFGLDSATDDLGLEVTDPGEDAQPYDDIDEMDEIGVDTQQETSAVESQMDFVPESEPVTGAETAALESETVAHPEESAPGAYPEGVMPLAEGMVAAMAPPVNIGFGIVILLVPTVIVCTFAGIILSSTITIQSESFQSPDYLNGVMELVREYVLPKLL